MAILGLFSASSGRAAASAGDLENCYHVLAAAQETQNPDGSKTAELLTEDQNNARCNKKVLSAAANIQDAAQILSLAEIVGRNSNWPSAAPIYVLAAKIDQKKTCANENVLLSVKNGIAQPPDFPPLADVKSLMEACWPANQEAMRHLLVDADDSYSKQTLCPFLTKHGVAMTKLQQSVCKGTNQ